MGKIACFIACWCGLTFCFSQNEASHWYFGENAGLSFNLDSNTTTISFEGQLNTREGCASISDESGNLLFYTDGTTVYNRLHNIMVNGTGLAGDESSSQSAIVAPKSDDPNIYYIFTVGSNQLNTGLNYSEVDMSLDGGFGAITVKNINLLNYCSEKITAVLKDCISKDLWVVTFASEDGRNETYDTFHAFEVSNLGVNKVSVKSKFNTIAYNGRGYLKISPDGKKLACANVNDGLYLYDFKSNTGVVSNEQRINIFSPSGSTYPYGVEFSPNSQLLYIHSYNNYLNSQDDSDNPANHTSTLSQFNVASADVSNSQIIIDERQLYRGALQLGPDGKIYRALSASYQTGLPFLGVIQYPNIIGTGCGYLHNAINLAPSNSSQGLPPFISSFFNTKIDIIKNGEDSSELILCEGDTYTLTSEYLAGASYVWAHNGNILPDNGFDLEVSESGQYQVYIVPNNGDCAIEGEAFVVINPKPETRSSMLSQCDEDGLKDGVTLFNLTEAIDALTNGMPNRLIKFYSNLERTIEIDGSSFTNTTPYSQTIYVEVINTITGCPSTSELTLYVSNTDSNDTVLPAVCDDDGIEDGFYNFNLNDAKNAILSGLPNGLNVSYYETYTDALLEQNNLETSFTNTIPYSQTIYARIENSNNCYGISEILLTVEKLPEIPANETAYYCLNKAPYFINLNAGVQSDASNNYNYDWSTGENTYDIQINQPGTYSVHVTNINTGCFKSKTITVEPSNVAALIDINITDGTQNNIVTVLVSGEGEYEYQLVNGNKVTYAPYQKNNVFENVHSGLYTVFIHDAKNDCGTINEPISVVGFPKFFTPNGDGYNDRWQVQGISSMFQPDTEITIFDRFGKVLKQLNPLGDGWDGSFNGQILPADDYWFSVVLQDGRVFKNHFTLKH